MSTSVHPCRTGLPHDRHDLEGSSGRARNDASPALGDYPRRWAREYGARTALVAGTMRLTYAELETRIEHLATGLARLGIGCGKHAMLQMPNGIGFVTALFALMRAGAVPVLAMPTQRKHDIDALIRIAEPVAYLNAEHDGALELHALAAEIAASHPSLEHVIVNGDPDESSGFKTLAEVEALGVSHSMAAPSVAPPPAPDDVALLLLSGGSTSTPKLIPRTHADYAYNFTASAELCGLDADSVYLAVLPIAHNFTLACPGVLGTLACGGTVVLADTSSCDEAMPLIERERVTHVALVPPLARLWSAARDWETSDLSSLRVVQVGGARLDPELAVQLPARLGGHLQQVFGMAEGLVCYTRLDDPPRTVVETQGRPLSPRDEIRIVDADLNAVPPGTSGELLTRGPYTIRNYYRAPAHDATSFTADGFYRTGDLVRLTTDGNLVVVGRTKEQINRAGEKIAASDVEAQLKALPGVRDAAVVGVPDDVLGERICAFVLPDAQGCGATGAALKTALNTALAERGVSAFKQPDQYEAIEGWPLTPVGKIDRTRLAALAAQRSAAAEPVRRYVEQRVAVTSTPLELAARLSRTLSAEHCTVYERHGEWSIGIDAVLTLTMDRDGTLRRSDDAPVSTGVAQALDDLPFEGWRAYGRVAFEFAHLSHGLSVPPDGEPLVVLHVPRSEIRLRDGEALIRSLEPGALAALAEFVVEQDAVGPMQPGVLLPIPDHASETDYKRRVAAALDEMRAKTYQKVILSRTVEAPLTVDMPQSYLEGRRKNTPARSFLLRDGTFEAYGFSPETIVEVDARRRVSTQPLAGTRALTGDATVDTHLADELRSDAKEIAEHAVSVQLAMAEMATVCAADTVAVSEFMAVRARGTVQHLASRVDGRLAEGRHPWDAFTSLFPAVTASGIPKREALQSIGRHEGRPRGLYSGAVLIADADGTLDAALVLRAAYRDGKRCWLQAGAGLVPLSRPEREWTETCEKLACVAQHLRAVPQVHEALASGGATQASRS